jgi:4,5-dihydroxyphthalate decarboxylase
VIRIGLRRSLVKQHPRLPGAQYKSFETSKNLALEQLADDSASKATLPFVEVYAQRMRMYAQRMRQLIGQDYWPYGVATNHHGLQTFLRHHQRQGLSVRELAVDEPFHPATLRTFKV